MKWLKLSAQCGLLVALCLLAACTKKTGESGTPEAALEAYVRTAFSLKKLEDSSKLLELSTGEARDWLAAMTESSFKEKFIDNSMLLLSLKTRDLREEKSGDVSLVYELSYRDGKFPDSAAYSARKIAYLTKDEKGLWKIKATKNVKTFIERKDDLVVPPNTPETSSKEPAPEEKHQN